MEEWLGRASQRHEKRCHDQEVMGLNSGWIKLGVWSTSV